jgi:ParB/RepB/Spo0J family partition protein
MVPSYTAPRVSVDEIVVLEGALRGVEQNSPAFQNFLASVRSYGKIISPILVRRDEEGQLVLVDGLQRLTASKLLGYPDIPVHELSQDEVEALCAQVTLNATRVETTPSQFTKAMLVIMAAKPNMTRAQLAESVGRSIEWLNERLSLQNLVPSLAAHLDAGRIHLTAAYSLAKLPPEEQPEWEERALTESADAINVAVRARLDQLRKDKAAGRRSNPMEFIPKPSRRSTAEIEDAIRADLPKEWAAKYGLEQVGKIALQWVLSLDPASVAAQKEKHDAAVAAARMASAKRRETTAAAARLVEKLGETKISELLNT